MEEKFIKWFLKEIPVLTEKGIIPAQVAHNLNEYYINKLADEINKRGGNAEFYADREELKKRIDELIRPGDIILILGPEDIRELGDELCP